ncbi:transcobalamin-2 [Rhinophrynus dorsalis]
MATTWPILVILAQCLITSVKLCEIPEGNTRLIQSLNLKLLRSTLDVSTKPNPSIYIGLRLSEDHSLAREADYLQRLKTSLETINSGTKTDNQDEPSTGIIALYLLALKASCEDMDKPERIRLITKLKSLLHEEKKQIVGTGQPESNYFQISLGIMALCVHGKKVDLHVIQKLLNWEGQDAAVHGDMISVDTEAVAGLAFLCLKRSGQYPPTVNAQLRAAVKSVNQKILTSQTKEGTFGNIYSTPLAVQFFTALGNSKDRQECPKATAALLEAMKQGKFSNPMMMSQLMPALHKKSYLDVAKVDCTNNKDNLFISPSPVVLPEVPVGEDLIHIQLTVEVPSGQLFTQEVEVPSRSSLHDIMKTAQKQNSQFTFETKDSLYGPFLTSVNGIAASSEERTYWQLLKDPNISLIEGIADYRPEDGEIIIFRLSKY